VLKNNDKKLDINNEFYILIVVVLFEEDKKDGK
jgi:hypothetical protein